MNRLKANPSSLALETDAALVIISWRICGTAPCRIRLEPSRNFSVGILVSRRGTRARTMKKIFVTGASSGIGLAIARLLTKGHEVWGTSRDPKRIPVMPRLHPAQLELSDSR